MPRYTYRLIYPRDATCGLRPGERLVQLSEPGYMGDVIMTYAEREVPFHSRIATRRRRTSP